MELIQAIKHELDLYLEGYLQPEDYEQLVQDLFCFVQGEGQKAYINGLKDAQKGGEKK